MTSLCSRARSRDRRFNTIDGMILVAAVAVGLAAAIAYRGQAQADLRRFFGEVEKWDSLFAPTFWIGAVIESGKPLLLSLTAIMPLLRLRAPRPRLREAMRQPGLAACATVIAVFLIGVVVAVASRLAVISTLGRDSEVIFESMESWTTFGNNITNRGGEAVVAVWLVLWLSRACRHDGGWIDRLGLVLGSLWVLYLFSGCISQFAWAVLYAPR